MTETAAGAASVGKMPDAEKLPDEQRPVVDMPDKAELLEPSPHDADSSDKAEAAAQEKKSSEGSVRDYFVSAG